MNTEYIIDKEQIKKINRGFGGSLRTDAEIEVALEMGKGRGVYMKIAYIWRAILVGRPFTDGNKRTALGTAFAILESAGIKTLAEQEDRVVEEAVKIAIGNIMDVGKIERRIRYAVEGN